MVIRKIMSAAEMKDKSLTPVKKLRVDMVRADVNFQDPQNFFGSIMTTVAFAAVVEKGNSIETVLLAKGKVLAGECTGYHHRQFVFADHIADFALSADAIIRPEVSYILNTLMDS